MFSVHTQNPVNPYFYLCTTVHSVPCRILQAGGALQPVAQYPLHHGA